MMEKLKIEATLENLDRVQNFIRQQLEAVSCPMRTMMQVEVAVEEIYVNIARYAYAPISGDAEIVCEVGGTPLQVIIQFLDHGVPFNPLESGDVDTSLSSEQREIGGLGILMVKKSMDEVEYSFVDGKNILTLKKII